MSIATDIRAYADLAREQGRAVLNQAGTAAADANKRLIADAGKQVRAAVGAADLLAEAVGKQVETLGKQAEQFGRRMEALPELPAVAAGNLLKAQQNGKALLDRAQDDALARLSELRGRLDAGLDTARSLPSVPLAAAGTTTGYLDSARESARQAYDRLTSRGEARLAELRKDRRVGKLLGEFDAASAAVTARIAPVLGTVRNEVASDLDSAADSVRELDLGIEPRTAARKPAASRTPRSRTAPATKSASATKAAKATSSTRTTPAKSTRSTAAKTSGTGKAATKKA